MQNAQNFDIYYVHIFYTALLVYGLLGPDSELLKRDRGVSNVKGICSKVLGWVWGESEILPNVQENCDFCCKEMLHSSHSGVAITIHGEEQSSEDTKH